ncbi:YybS family protein [Sporosarcina contaminans]|uniref:YybS family protein n=1 Tax=Sporosarcina contaminans TaxID=633403 RepID=A0ABW3TUV3_9BACL
MQDPTKKITYGAMMSALFTILLVGSFYLPVIGVLMMLFVPIPMILYRLKHDRTSSIFVVLIAIVLSLIPGGLLILPTAIIFGFLGFIIGELIVLKKTKLYIYMASGLFMLVSLILLYIGSIFLFNINPIDGLMASMDSVQQRMMEIFTLYGELPKDYEEVIESAFQTYKAAIPALFITSTYVFTFMIIMPSLEVVRRMGFDVPKFPPFREMKLPVVTIFVYGLLILLPFIMDMKVESTIYLIYINATIILRLLFLLQGIALIHYFMHKMKLPGVVTFFTTVLAILLNPITTLLGIVDIGMNIRAWIGKDNLK